MSFTLECRKVRESESAVCVIDTNTGETLWFPFSQTESMHFDRNNNGTIVVTDWIAATKGLT